MRDRTIQSAEVCMGGLAISHRCCLRYGVGDSAGCGTALNLERGTQFGHCSIDAAAEHDVARRSHLRQLAQNVPVQPVYWTSHSKGGVLVKPWNLIVPKAVRDRSWEER